MMVFIYHYSLLALLLSYTCHSDALHLRSRMLHDLFEADTTIELPVHGTLKLTIEDIDEPCLSKTPLPPEKQDDLVTCVAVIDENNGKNVDTLWEELRDKYPDRPFCLLRPMNPGDDLSLPTNFYNESTENIFSDVVRDFNDPTKPTDDWYELCNLDASLSNRINHVISYIDNSGSTLINHVQKSLDLFLKTAKEKGFTVIEPVVNSDEDYITPCLNAVVKGSTNGSKAGKQKEKNSSNNNNNNNSNSKELNEADKQKNQNSGEKQSDQKKNHDKKQMKKNMDTKNNGKMMGSGKKKGKKNMMKAKNNGGKKNGNGNQASKKKMKGKKNMMKAKNDGQKMMGSGKKNGNGNGKRANNQKKQNNGKMKGGQEKNNMKGKKKNMMKAKNNGQKMGSRGKKKVNARKPRNKNRAKNKKGGNNKKRGNRWRKANNRTRS